MKTVCCRCGRGRCVGEAVFVIDWEHVTGLDVGAGEVAWRCVCSECIEPQDLVEEDDD